MGFLPSINGLSWLAVEEISNLPLPLFNSQAQPEPKRPAAAELNFSLNESKLPKFELITLAMSPVGAPPAFPARIGQKNEWFAWPPPLLRTAVLTASGTIAQLFASNSSRLLPDSSGAESSALFKFVT